MKTNEILGRKIIDKNVKEVGKIAEITANSKTFKISEIYGSYGSPISKKYFKIETSDVMALGDYLQVNLTKEEIEERATDKISPLPENTIKINGLINKKTLDSNGNECGKISNIDVDFDEMAIKDIIVSKSSTFGKTDGININESDIMGLGDYLIINKVIKKESTEEEKDEADEAEDEEKVNVNID